MLKDKINNIYVAHREITITVYLLRWCVGVYTHLIMTITYNMIIYQLN